MPRIDITYSKKYSRNNCNDSTNRFIESIPSIFNLQGTLLYDERNTVKSFSISNPDIPFSELVIKKFKKPNIIQRIAYSFFRENKAVRAFKNAEKLLEQGIATPQGIACIVIYNNLFLNSSYLVTTFTNGRPIMEFFTTPQEFNHLFIKEFGAFAVKLHQKGILHHDLNSTNVLYHQTENGSFFSVIDINRMSFKSPQKISPADCFENLTRFTGDMILFELVVQHYVNLRGWNENLVNDAIRIKIKHDKHRIRKKTFLASLKRICHV